MNIRSIINSQDEDVVGLTRLSIGAVAAVCTFLPMLIISKIFKNDDLGVGGYLALTYFALLIRYALLELYDEELKSKQMVIDDTADAALDSEENTYQHRLFAAGFTDVDIRNDPVLGRYIDPLTLELMRHPVRDNNGDILDKASANKLIRRNMQLFGFKGPVTGYTESAELQTELERAVADALMARSGCRP